MHAWKGVGWQKQGGCSSALDLLNYRGLSFPVESGKDSSQSEASSAIKWTNFH
jgi:hypothetical protein